MAMEPMRRKTTAKIKIRLPISKQLNGTWWRRLEVLIERTYNEKYAYSAFLKTLIFGFGLSRNNLGGLRPQNIGEIDPSSKCLDNDKHFNLYMTK